MGSGFDDWVYWHFFKITVDYNNSLIELLLSHEYPGLISTIPLEFTNALPFTTVKRPEYKSPCRTVPPFFCVVTGVPLLPFFAAETSVYLAVN
jgi:hypothetical protein